MRALLSPDTKNEVIAGITDNTIKGKLIKTKNLFLERIAFVLSQKYIPLKVKLISPLLFITRI